jgi:uncharacterized protein YciI
MADSQPFDNSPIPKDFIAGEIRRRKTYYLLLYSMGTGDRSNLGLLEKSRAEHVEYLYKLRRHGTLVLHGPMQHPDGGPDYPLRGVNIFHAGSLEEVRRYGESDPMVRAGFLGFEVFPFNGHPGDRLP